MMLWQVFSVEGGGSNSWWPGYWGDQPWSEVPNWLGAATFPANNKFVTRVSRAEAGAVCGWDASTIWAAPSHPGLGQWYMHTLADSLTSQILISEINCFLLNLWLSLVWVFFGTVLQVVLKKTPPADVIRVTTQMLISTLTKNLTRMEPATKRNSVSGSHYLAVEACFYIRSLN